MKYRYCPIGTPYIEFWSTDSHPEELSARTIDEATEACAPGPVTVYGFVRTRINLDPEAVVEEIYGELWEDHGDPEGTDIQGPTPAVIAAAEELVRVIQRDFRSWVCEQVCAVRMEVSDVTR